MNGEWSPAARSPRLPGKAGESDRFMLSQSASRPKGFRILETTKWRYTVPRKEIHYLRTTMESYDGMVVVRTVDPGKATIELLIAPGCEDLVLSLLTALREKEGIRLEPAETEPGREPRAR